MHRLAIAFCLQLLEGELTAVERGSWTIELIRCHAQDARDAAPGDRPARWRQAREVAATFAREHRDSPRLILVRIQDAMTCLAEGELIHQEAELGRGEPGVARERIRESIRLLEQLDKELAQEIARRAGRPARADQLGGNELVALAYHVSFHAARAFRLQAQLYAERSADRAASLSQALRRLEKPIREVAPDTPLFAELRFEEITCLTLQGDYRQARERLGTIDGATPPPPPETRLRVRAELLRVALLQGDLPQARQLLAAGREMDGQISPDLDLAILETQIRHWTAAADKTEAARWRDQALATASFIEDTHGGPWGQRANLLLLRHADGPTGEASVELLARAADRLYLNGQHDEAIAAYERAAGAAEAAADLDVALELGYRAALVEQARQRPEAAATRMRQLATRWPRTQRAPSVHGQAVGIAVETARADPDKLSWYEELLREHLATWPSEPSAYETRLWLGRLEETRRQWRSALDAYEAIPRDATVWAEVPPSVARCWGALLAEAASSGAPLQEPLEAALRFLESAAMDGGKWPDSWSDTARAAVVEAARLRLRYSSSGFRRAEELLRAALEGEPTPSDDWSSSARALLVVALAGQPDRIAEASNMLREAADASPRRLVEMLEQLAMIVDASPPRLREPLARLTLGGIELLGARRGESGDGKLNAHDQRLVARLRAESLALTGQRSAALDAYQQLAVAHPDDATIQEGLARLLQDSHDPEELRRAEEQWRLVASRTPKNTPRWIEARYSVALVMYQRGDRQGAAERLRLLLATAKLESADRARITDLLRRCEAQ